MFVRPPVRPLHRPAGPPRRAQLSVSAAEGGGSGPWWGEALYGADVGLVLDFENNRTYNAGVQSTPYSLLTYTAPSPKLVYGTDGVLGYMSQNTVTYSEQFDHADWSKANTTITANQAVAPDGNTTADLLTKTSASSSYVRQAPSTLAGQIHVWSVYAKVGTGTVVVMGSGQTSQYVDFDLVAVTATVTSGSSTASITAVGNGWYRCAMTINTPTTLTGYEISPKTNGETLYIWGAQREEVRSRTVATAYLLTTSAYRYDMPIDYDPITLACKGVLIEEARTNLLTYSQTFSDAVWAKTQGSVTDNNITAPDGTTTGARFLETTANAQHFVGPTAGNLVTSGAAYTFSAYVQTLGRQWVSLNVYDTANRTTYFDIVNGVIGTTAAGTTASIQNVGNGWYRCVITLTVAFTTVYAAVVSASADGTNTFAGDITKGFYLWGAQLEAGAFATSYIPTVASQVTRAADNLSLLTSAFPWNAAAGTMVAEYYDAGVNAGLWRIDDNGDNEYFRVVRDTGSMVASMVDGGSAVGSVYLTATAQGTLTKLATAWDATSMNAAINGSLGTQDSSVTLPTVLTLRIGNNRNAQYHGRHIVRLAYWPTRKTNAYLQQVTT